MSELNEAWAAALAEAEGRARAAGRTDISEYLALKTSNDLLRNTGSGWLLSNFEDAAAEANRRGAPVQVAKNDSHRFAIGNAVMVGNGLTLINGARELLIEVGWPRAPRDGFIRGGGLAIANIKHRGLKHASVELRLVVDPEGVPRWIYESKHADHLELHESDIRDHVARLIR